MTVGHLERPSEVTNDTHTPPTTTNDHHHDDHHPSVPFHFLPSLPPSSFFSGENVSSSSLSVCPRPVVVIVVVVVFWVW